MNKPVDIETELDLAQNMFGSLKPEIKNRIRKLYTNPTATTWEDAHCIIVGHDRFMTLWQAIIAVDPTFPRMGRATDQEGKVIDEWKRIPDQTLIRKALYYATH
jgi:hypothetical protein